MQPVLGLYTIAAIILCVRTQTHIHTYHSQSHLIITHSETRKRNISQQNKIVLSRQYMERKIKAKQARQQHQQQHQYAAAKNPNSGKKMKCEIEKLNQKR